MIWPTSLRRALAKSFLIPAAPEHEHPAHRGRGDELPAGQGGRRRCSYKGPAVLTARGGVVVRRRGPSEDLNPTSRMAQAGSKNRCRHLAGDRQGQRRVGQSEADRLGAERHVIRRRRCVAGLVEDPQKMRSAGQIGIEADQDAARDWPDRALRSRRTRARRAFRVGSPVRRRREWT